MTTQPPGCCGNLRCQGCAWECDHPDGHDYAFDPSLAVAVTVSVHGARDLNPQAREALDALIDVATKQISEEPKP